MRWGHDVVDVVQPAFGGLILEPVDDEPADTGAAAGPADHEGNLRVAPFAVQPAVAGHRAVVVGDPPPLVGYGRPGRRDRDPDRGELLRPEQPLLIGVPSGGIFL